MTEVALRHAARLGVAGQVHGLTGDMFSTDLGGPYDLVLITNVLHHFSAAKAAELLRRAASVTRPGGKVAVVGFVTDPARSPAADRQAHMFALLMLAWTADGEVHTAENYRRMLGSAGYADVTVHLVPGLPAQVMVATRDLDICADGDTVICRSIQYGLQMTTWRSSSPNPPRRPRTSRPFTSTTSWERAGVVGLRLRRGRGHDHSWHGRKT